MAINIGLFIPSLNGGGAERAALLLARHWPESGRAVLIMRSDMGQYRDLVADLPQDMIAHLGLPPHGFGASLNTPNQLVRVVDEFALDAIITFVSLPSVAPLRLLRPRLALLASIQNPLDAVAGTDGVTARLKRKAVQATADIMMSAFDAIVVPSAGTAERLKARPILAHALASGRTSLCHVPNPLSPTTLSANAIATLSLEDTCHRVVTAGRLVPQKRLDIFVSAIAVLSRSTKVCATIFGEGPLRDELLRQAAHMGIAGALTIKPFENDLAQIYGRADVFVLTSDFEGFGNVLIEALGFGLPVISTDVPFGPREILADGRYGLLVPPGNPQAVANALRDALPGGAEHQRLVSGATERAQRYLAPRVAAEMSHCVAEAVNRRGRASHGSGD